jgi:hypothetical protein
VGSRNMEMRLRLNENEGSCTVGLGASHVKEQKNVPSKQAPGFSRPRSRRALLRLSLLGFLFGPEFCGACPSE